MNAKPHTIHREYAMNGIQYRIQVYPSYDGKWNLSVKKYVRTTFKRSKRTGWHCQGFVTCDEDLVRYATRAEARAAGNAVKQRLVGASLI